MGAIAVCTSGQRVPERAGSTACAFGHYGALFVATTGGIAWPQGAVPQPARLVRPVPDHDGGCRGMSAGRTRPLASVIGAG